MLSRCCKSCATVKPLSDFGKHKSGVDGVRSICKPCAVRHVTEYRKTKAGAAVLRAYRASAKSLESAKAANRKWVRSPKGSITKRKVEGRSPEKRRARAAVNWAVRTGKITPLPCLICGSDAEAHHPDYNEPLDVVWLCQSHHKQAHALVRAA